MGRAREAEVEKLGDGWRSWFSKETLVLTRGRLRRSVGAEVGSGAAIKNITS